MSAIAFALALAAPLLAQPPQTVQDEYAVYDLLAPETASFRTVYEVAVTTPGATVFPDRIGAGLTTANASDDGVVDLMSGAPLKYTVTSSAIEVQLARPVPADGGQARLRITKTYKDAKNYRRDGDGLVFDRAIADPARGHHPAGRLSADRVQRAVAGARGSRRPHPRQLHVSGAGRRAADPQGADPARRPATRRSRGR